MEIIVPYFKAGLKNNELCMWVTSEFLNVEEANEAKSSISDFITYIKKGQIENFVHGLVYGKWNF